MAQRKGGWMRPPSVQITFCPKTMKAMHTYYFANSEQEAEQLYNAVKDLLRHQDHPVSKQKPISNIFNRILHCNENLRKSDEA
jgi:hypothetical protein